MSDKFEEEVVRKYTQNPEAFKTEPYGFENDQLVKYTQTGPQVLANFKALITRDILRDDGSDSVRLVELECKLSGETRRFKLPIAAFREMNWPLDKLGPGAIIFQGHAGGLAQTRNAIQQLSLKEFDGRIPQETVYAHIGWRKIGNARFYLSAGRAIGECPGVDVRVELDEGMRDFSFPDLSTNWIDQAEAVRASLEILNLVRHDRQGFAVLASVYRAIVGAPDFTIHLVGPSGSGKTALAALAQQHFGPNMAADNLPASWSSTDNAIAMQAHQAKDALLVLDDFKPVGSRSQIEAMHARADRVLRGQGNRSSRRRLSADSSLLSAKPPRCLILSTGEDTPKGESARARTLIVEVNKGDIPLDNRLTGVQGQALSGRLAVACGSFIRWFAPQYEALQVRFRNSVTELATKFPRPHARTPQNLANLAAAFTLFVEFAQECKALNAAEANDMMQRCITAFIELGEVQQGHLQEYDPARVILEALNAALSAKTAHLADVEGRQPDHPEAYGWLYRAGGFEPQGERLGWFDDEGIYLVPKVALRISQRYSEESLSERELARRLFAQNFILCPNRINGKGRFEVRKTLESSRPWVWHLRPEAWRGGVSPEVSPVRPVSPMAPNGSSSGSLKWAPARVLAQTNDK